MSPAPGPWRVARLRFLAGGRADETPTDLFWEGRWRKVRPLGDERREGPRPGGPRARRLLLADEGGMVYELTGAEERGDWSWRGRSLGQALTAPERA